MFTAAKKEIWKTEKHIIENELKERYERIISKQTIVNSILWIKSLRSKAEAKKNDVFVSEANAVIENLNIAHGFFDKLEVEQRVLKHRNLDLEKIIIEQKSVIDSQRQIIANFENEFNR